MTELAPDCQYTGTMEGSPWRPYWESWAFRTRYEGAMTIEYRAWRWRRRWRVRFEGVCVAIPGGWEIFDFEGRGRTLEEACRNAEREERAAKRFRAPTIHIR